MGDRVRKRLVVKGRVQGVGFRYFTQQKATRLGIVGFVRNLVDGCVEIEAEGAVEDMEIFLGEINRGPSSARVTQVEQQALPKQIELESFEIKHF